MNASKRSGRLECPTASSDLHAKGFRQVVEWSSRSNDASVVALGAENWPRV